MIKINLLPFRAARKRENIRREVSIFILTMLFLVTVSGYLHLSLNQKLNHIKSEESRLSEESKKYDKILREIALLKKQNEDVKKRLGVIEGLESDRMAALLLLEEIAVATPVEKLWLNSLSESKGLLTLQGSAMDNNTVARFMTSLGKSEFISAVDLKSTQLQISPKNNLKTSNFIITCKTSFMKPKPEPAPEKKGAK